MISSATTQKPSSDLTPLTPWEQDRMREAASMKHAGSSNKQIAAFMRSAYDLNIGETESSPAEDADADAEVWLGTGMGRVSRELGVHALQGLTFGFGDEAIGRMVGLLGGVSATEGRDMYRAVAAKGAAEHPWASMGAQAAGAIPSMVVGGGVAGVGKAAQTMGTAGRLGLAAAEGGVAGGLMGAGNADGGTMSDRATGAIVGGVTGFLTAPLLVGGAMGAVGVAKTATRVAGSAAEQLSPTIANWSQRLQSMVPGVSPSVKARQELAKALIMDHGSLDNAGKWFQDQWAKGVPVVLADAGENTRALMQSASGFRHPGKQQMIEDIFQRQGDQGMRSIQKLFTVGKLGLQNAYDAADTHMATARAQAAPFYYVAHRTDITPTARLLKLLEEPDFHAAWDAGQITAAAEDLGGLARGNSVPSLKVADPGARGAAYDRLVSQGVNPAKAAQATAHLPGDIEPPGTVLNTSLPIRGLDYMKQELDEIISGRYKTDKVMSGRRATALRAQLNSVLDDPAIQVQSPEWVQGRSIFRGAKELTEAIQAGKGGRSLNSDVASEGGRFVNRPTAIVKREFAAYTTPTERQGYMIGAMQDLADEVASNKQAGANVAQSVFGARTTTGAQSGVMENLKAIMPDKHAAQLVQDYLTGEANISKLARSMGGSITASKTQGMADLGHAATGTVLPRGAGTSISLVGQVKDRIRLGVVNAVADEISNLGMRGINGPHELIATGMSLYPHAPLPHLPAIPATIGGETGKAAAKALRP